MDKFQSSRQKRISLRQEKLAAQDVGGLTTAGSGAAKTSGGGDVRVAGKLRIECKYTEKSFFVLELAVLKKIQMEALKGGMEQPVLQLTFVAKHTGAETSFAILPHAPKKSDGTQFFHTDRARIRLHKVEIQREILRYGSTQVLFSKAAIGGHVFSIVHWHTFLASREEDKCEHSQYILKPHPEEPGEKKPFCHQCDDFVEL